MSNLKVTTPDNHNDISVDMFTRYLAIVKRDLSELESDRRIISAFTGIPYQQTIKIANKDFKRLKIKIDNALKTDADFMPRFEIDGVEFGFEPNIDGISAGHNADLLEYADDDEQLNRYMACLFRPIINEDAFGNYAIEPYGGTEKYAAVLNGAPLSALKGARVFFSSLANDLLKSGRNSIRKELAKAAQP